MNLKLKTTLLWLRLVIVSAVLTSILLATIWVLVTYPIIVGIITISALIIFVIVESWLAIYYDLKEEVK